eukprot:COSAG01_NODE_41228_length_454_cov_0.819718_1_plen_123_part_01
MQILSLAGLMLEWMEADEGMAPAVAPAVASRPDQGTASQETAASQGTATQQSSGHNKRSPWSDGTVTMFGAGVEPLHGPWGSNVSSADLVLELPVGVRRVVISWRSWAIGGGANNHMQRLVVD